MLRARAHESQIPQSLGAREPFGVCRSSTHPLPARSGTAQCPNHRALRHARHPLADDVASLDLCVHRTPLAVRQLPREHVSTLSKGDEVVTGEIVDGCWTAMRGEVGWRAAGNQYLESQVVRRKRGAVARISQTHHQIDVLFQRSTARSANATSKESFGCRRASSPSTGMTHFLPKVTGRLTRRVPDTSLRPEAARDSASSSSASTRKQL